MKGTTLSTPLSCSDLMAEAESEYTALPLATRAGGIVHLRNLLMLSPEGLNSARVILDAFGNAEADFTAMLPQMRDLLLLISDGPKVLAKEMQDWPLGMYVRVVEAWQGATQSGEALDSAS